MIHTITPQLEYPLNDYQLEALSRLAESLPDKVYEHQTTKHNSELYEELEALKALVNSEDFVLVPKEPTQRMLNAGHIVMNPIKGSDVHSGTNQKRRDCYKAMIDAYLKYGDEPRVG